MPDPRLQSHGAPAGGLAVARLVHQRTKGAQAVLAPAEAVPILLRSMASLSDLQERSRGIQARLAQLKEGL